MLLHQIRLLATQEACEENDVVQRTASVQADDMDAGWYLVDERTLNPVQDQGHAQPCAMQLARERDALPLRSAAGEAGHVDRDRPGPTVRSGRRSRLPCGLVAIAVRRHLHAACTALPSHPARRLIFQIRLERLNA